MIPESIIKHFNKAVKTGCEDLEKLLTSFQKMLKTLDLMSNEPDDDRAKILAQEFRSKCIEIFEKNKL